jgi:hypothetical protein
LTGIDHFRQIGPMHSSNFHLGVSLLDSNQSRVAGRAVDFPDPPDPSPTREGSQSFDLSHLLFFLVILLTLGYASRDRFSPPPSSGRIQP